MVRQMFQWWSPWFALTGQFKPDENLGRAGFTLGVISRNFLRSSPGADVAQDSFVTRYWRYYRSLRAYRAGPDPMRQVVYVMSMTNCFLLAPDTIN
ncbi:MAG: hypothetical protein R3C05_13900 [Pirellulaceae bacterium]